MQYLLLIYEAEGARPFALPEAQRAEIHGAYSRFTQDIKASGHLLGGNALQPVHTATTVRVRDNKATMTDGPFAETREQLGGYYLIEATDLDEATKIAARIPGATTGSIEVRPIMNVSM
jgi:hypothetical protein|nr:YciI family protein [Kofleriaceae bacterium]